MASIICTHCGATLKTKTAVKPGKKFKCPKCGKAFAVEAPADEAPVQGSPGKKAKSDMPKSSGMLFGLVGGTLLLCCCCTTIPGGGWYFRDKLGLGDPTKSDMVNKGDGSK